MKKLAIAVLAVLSLSACGSAAPDSENSIVPDETGVISVDTPDGRVVECAIWAGGKAGGIDCDWEDAE